jgi:hypothetical protein
VAVDRRALRGLLERLEEHWRLVGAPIVDCLRPGLAEEEIDALTAPLGLRLPGDVRELFAWHDGAPPAVDRELSIGPANSLLSLSDQVATCWRERAYAEELARAGSLDSAEQEWGRSWFPVLGGSGSRSLIVVDCAVEEGSPAPVGHLDKEVVHRPSAVLTFSDVVRFWVECFDSGAYSWSPEHEQFLPHWSAGFPPVPFQPYY